MIGFERLFTGWPVAERAAMNESPMAP